MYQGGNQVFASPEEALAHISEQAWSDYTKADYTLEQWHAACLVHVHDGEPTSKSQCKLPVKTPNGALNRNGVHAAAAALAGARGGLKGVSDDQKKKAASALRRYYSQLEEEPPESLSHHGVKGMRWGVRKKEETSPRETARKNETSKSKLEPGLPDFQQRIGRITRTDRPQMLTPPRIERREGGRVGPQQVQEKQGLTRNQKILLGVGVAGVAAAGYVAYRHYSGNRLDIDLAKAKQEVQQLEKMKLPADWDVRSLKNTPLSKQPLGALTGSNVNARLLDLDNLVIDTSRGYADIIPKDGFGHSFAAEQHDSVIRVLDQMREKYPAIRNMNIEVLPMSSHPGMGLDANMCVLPMRSGEARIMYNDIMDAPTAEIIRANRRFLPGLGAKDYVAQHEMGHLLAVAGGQLPPAEHLLRDNASPTAWKLRSTAEPLLHKKMFAKYGFTFKELSKISQYAATEPAEAMAELAGHYFNPEMQSRLTPSQIRRAEAMFNEMGGLT